MRKFVGRPLLPEGDGFVTPATGSEPPLPRALRWQDGTIVIVAIRRAWRSTRSDRGDSYLKRHWYEVETAAGEIATLYYDREARRGAPQWWLYAVEESER